MLRSVCRVLDELCIISKSSIFLHTTAVVRHDNRIIYPNKPIQPKRHKYDYETHKKYARAMAEIKSKKRRDVSVFVENTRMISDLLSQGYKPSHIFYVQEELLHDFKIPDTTATIQITGIQMARLTDFKAAEGIVAVFGRPNSFPANKKYIPLIIYLDNIEDPGNCGTIIRSAAGAECMSIVSSPDTVGLWQPHVVQASAAANFIIPIYENMDFEVMLENIPEDWNICFTQTYTPKTTQPSHTIPYYEADFSNPMVLVLGNAVFGMPHNSLNMASRKHNVIQTHIPICKDLDSLSVGAAATVLIFEMAKQQQRLKTSEEESPVHGILDNLEKSCDISSTSANTAVSANTAASANTALAADNIVVDELDKIFEQPKLNNKVDGES